VIDLDQVVVITGFAEVQVSPMGSSRTRWELEGFTLAIEGCIKMMAWIMGFIKHFDGGGHRAVLVLIYLLAF
jgi:fatty acid synthase subunit alpha